MLERRTTPEPHLEPEPELELPPDVGSSPDDAAPAPTGEIDVAFDDCEPGEEGEGVGDLAAFELDQAISQDGAEDDGGSEPAHPDDSSAYEELALFDDPPGDDEGASPAHDELPTFDEGDLGEPDGPLGTGEDPSSFLDEGALPPLDGEPETAP
jgi:hypothetical protein